jgi:hypothetical protein
LAYSSVPLSQSGLISVSRLLSTAQKAELHGHKDEVTSLVRELKASRDAYRLMLTSLVLLCVF